MVVKQQMKDELGLKKLEKDLNRAFDFDFFPKSKKQNRTPSKKQSKKEKKFFNGGTRKRSDYSQEIKVIKATARETKKGFSKLYDNIKNRKIRKLEKEALKTKEQADKLRHEIKTRQALEDNLTDIARMENELEKIKQEERERKAQLEDKRNSETTNV